MGKVVVFFASALACLVAMPLFVPQKVERTGEAKSPETTTLSIGTTKTVAGGKAELWFAGGKTGADFQVACKSGKKYVEPKIGTSYSGCGIDVELLKVEEAHRGQYAVPQATYRITWKK